MFRKTGPQQRRNEQSVSPGDQDLQLRECLAHRLGGALCRNEEDASILLLLRCQHVFRRTPVSRQIALGETRADVWFRKEIHMIGPMFWRHGRSRLLKRFDDNLLIVRVLFRIIRILFRPLLRRHFPGASRDASPVLLDQRVVLVRHADARPRPGRGHQFDMPIRFRRVMAAVITPVAEQRPLALRPSLRPRVWGQADERVLLRPFQGTEIESD